MALNALQADMVRFTGTPGVEVNGIIVGYRAEYTPRTSTDPKYDRLIDNKHSSNIDYSGQYYVQLGEELYNGDLTKKHVTDDFERPSYNWQYKGKEIGTYVDYTVLVNGGTFTEAVKYSELYELLTYTSINDNDIVFYIDGVQQTISKSQFSRSNKDTLKGDNNITGAGQGVLTEVFLDRDRELITITCINTYLAQANSDYNKTNETLSLKVYETGVSATTEIVDSKDVPEAEGVAKDDYKLVYLSGKNSNNNPEVVRMFEPTIMADSAITKYTKDNGAKVLDKLTTGGTEYKTNPKAFYDNGAVLYEYDNALLTDMTYNIYMDRYNNVIGVDLYEGTKNYVFITGYDRNGSNIAVNTATAAGIFTDGTMDTITVNVTDTNKNIDRYNSKFGFSNAKGNLSDSYFQSWTAGGNDGDRTLNRWYTYTVTNSGVYTLKPVERSFYTAYTAADDGISNANPKVLNSSNLYVDDDRSESYGDPDASVDQARAYGNDNSIYITVSGDEVDTSVANAKDAITDVDGVYTGAQNVKLELTPSHKGVINTTNGKDKTTENNAYVYTVYDNKYYIVASIVIGEAQGANANYAYILSDAKNERIEREGDARANGDVTYYWEFDAVVNGEKTTLTAKSRYANVFNADDVEKYTVRELRYDGEYVVGVKAPDASDYHTDNNDQTGIDKKDIYDIGNSIGQAGWSSSNVMDSPKSDVITSSDRVTGTIELVGRTLYVNPGPTRGVGLALASDAKAVLIQPENGDREVTSCGSVAEALGRLADRSEADGMQFKGRVVAVLKDGIAQWVVIISDTDLRTGNNPNYNQSSSVTFGNIRIEVYGMGTQNVTGYINADGDLNIVLPTTPTLVRAIPDNYDVDVYVNGALIGTILTPSAQSTDGKTVTYTLTGAKLTATNMQIVARVYPEGSTTPPTPGSDPIPAADVKVTAPTAPAKVGDTIGNATVDSSTKFTVTSQVKNPADGKAVEGKNTLTVTLTATGNNVFSGTYSVAGAKSATVGSAGKTLTIVYEWTVEGGTDPKPPVTGDLPKATETGGTITLPYYKTEPTADEVKAKIQADLPDLGVTSVMGKAPSYTAYKADGSSFTVNLDEQIKVTLNSASGTVLGYVKKGTAGTVNAPDKTKAYIIPAAGEVAAAAKANASNAEKIAVNSTTDVVVYEAVELADGSITTMATSLKISTTDVNGDVTWDVVGSNKFVKTGATIRVFAVAKPGEFSAVTLNGKNVPNTEKYGAVATDILYTYTVDANDVDATTKKITLDQVAGKKVVIKVGATETPVGVVSSTGAISVASSFADATDGTIYVPVTATTAWESAANNNNVVELTRAIGTDGNTVIAKGTMNAGVYGKAVDGVITLVPAAKVTVKTAADIAKVEASYGSIAATTLTMTDGMYVADGAKLEITSKNTSLTEGQFIGVKVGSADVAEADESVPAASATDAATGEHTIGGIADVVISLEAAPVAP